MMSVPVLRVSQLLDAEAGMDQGRTSEMEDKLTTYHGFLFVLRLVILLHLAGGAFLALWWAGQVGWIVAALAAAAVLLVGAKPLGVLSELRQLRHRD